MREIVSTCVFVFNCALHKQLKICLKSGIFLTVMREFINDLYIFLLVYVFMLFVLKFLLRDKISKFQSVIEIEVEYNVRLF